jgi:pimeloyl-ACP methyl ester carboxylesterase
MVTRGTRVRVRRAGKGKPVLFLHGAGGWPAWLPFFERLSPSALRLPSLSIRALAAPTIHTGCAMCRI